MSAKRRPQPLRPARSVAEVSDSTVIPVDFPSSAAEAVAETREYYNYLRQRAAETPLQTRMLSRASTLSKDEKKRWSEHGEQKRSNLMAMIDIFISELESDPAIDTLKKLSIARAVWSIMQIELDDASCAMRLERIAAGKEARKRQTALAGQKRRKRKELLDEVVPALAAEELAKPGKSKFTPESLAGAILESVTSKLSAAGMNSVGVDTIAERLRKNPTTER
jgi:hypothetical protein